MELQLAQLIEHMDATPGAVGEWREFADRQVSSGDPDLRIGIEFFDPEGATPGERRRRVDDERAAAADGCCWAGRTRGSREVDVGWSYPYLVLSGRGKQGIVQLMVYSRPFARNVAAIRDAFWTAAPVMLLVTALLGYLLSRGAAADRDDHAQRPPHLDAPARRDDPHHRLGRRTRRARHDAQRHARPHSRGRGAHARASRPTPRTSSARRSTRCRARLDVTLAKERTPEEYRVVLGDLHQQVVTLVGHGERDAATRAVRGRARRHPHRARRDRLAARGRRRLLRRARRGARRRALRDRRVEGSRARRSDLAAPALRQPDPQRDPVHARRRQRQRRGATRRRRGAGARARHRTRA